MDDRRRNCGAVVDLRKSLLFRMHPYSFRPLVAAVKTGTLMPAIMIASFAVSVSLALLTIYSGQILRLDRIVHVRGSQPRQSVRRGLSDRISGLVKLQQKCGEFDSLSWQAAFFCHTSQRS